MHTVGAAGNYAIRARVTTPQQCNFSLSPAGHNLGTNGGTGSVAVGAAAGCVWTATSNANGVTIASGASGAGAGTVNYNAAANPSDTPRNTTLMIAGLSFAVSRSGSGHTPAVDN